MFTNILASFADTSRVWIYPFKSELSPHDRVTVDKEMTQFITQWKSHGTPVKGEFTILHKRFVLICIDPETDISGCSIDSSVRVFKILKEHHGLDALDPNLLFYKSDNGIKAISRPDLKQKISENKITPQTIVYNLSAHTLGEVREGLLESRFSESRHAAMFTVSP